MGTRNVTIVKCNGETKVAQYGQWDGYPTYTLKRIVDFLQINKNVKLLRLAMDDCHLVDGEEIERFIREKFLDTFNTLYKKISNLYEKLRAFDSDYDAKIDLVAKECGVSKHDVFIYYTLTRDTGCDILHLLTTLEAMYSTEGIMLDHCPETRTDWQIEAVNTIDLDNNTITSEWHGDMRSWSFDDLPNEEEIMAFENGEQFIKMVDVSADSLINILSPA